MWFSLFGLALVRTAWIGDDAYFTFRTIDNFVHGYGLRWNVAERVQAYTHPLWMFLVAACYWLTGEAYFTALMLSMALTMFTLWRVMRLAPTVWSAALGLTVLLFSRAFVDYSTSGLENALTNALLVALYGVYLSEQRRVFAPALLTALIALNRLDAALLVLPAFIAMRPGWGDHRAAVRVAAGLLPLVAWEIFSLVYYGVPFPNTAYAKLKTGIPERELLAQGLLYLLDSVRRDPLTLIVILATAAWSIATNARRTRPIAVGALGYVVYVTYVGGDFMSGRMFAAPLLAAAVILVAADVASWTRPHWILVAVAVVVGLNAPHAFSGGSPAEVAQALGPTGIADERLVYFRSSGLVNFSRDGLWPADKLAENGIQAKREGQRFVAFCCDGMFGYFAGPGVHVLDTLALGDPLLARLPAERPWRIGHFARKIPAGYGETLKTGVNHIRDPDLAAYYDRLSLITRGPIWDRRRLRAILKFNTGAYDDLLAPGTARVPRS